MNGHNLKAVIVEAHPYATESNRTDISISSAEKPGEILYYVDTTVTNLQSHFQRDKYQVTKVQTLP